MKIWDLPVRVFHWTLVIGIGFMWFSAETGGLWMDWHMRAGIFLLALVLFRIVWGLMGSDTARFSRFVKSPVHALGHLKELGSRAPAWHVGHNPLGAWMVVALLLTVLVQAVTGLFASDDIMVEGPLYGLVSSAFSGRMTGLHHQVFNLLLLLVVLHVAAVLFYRFYKGTNRFVPW
ncbi:MAG TPA: cytochrome b/b6 domain-containing protein [Thiolinea sp.]|nr:cytochrome b/b6 domain-containing protein [Thiolinea sp.]